MGKNPQRRAVNDAKKIPFCLSEMLFTRISLSKQKYTNITEDIDLSHLTYVRFENMPKKKPKIKLESFGRYTTWEKGSKKLPKILEFTQVIHATEGNEFGLVLKIEGGKGARLDYCIKHPPFRNASGEIEPDFTGEYYVKSNHFDFFIGDSIWAPIENKVGIWEITVLYEGSIVVSKIFEVIIPE